MLVRNRYRKFLFVDFTGDSESGRGSIDGFYKHSSEVGVNGAPVFAIFGAPKLIASKAPIEDDPLKQRKSLWHIPLGNHWRTVWWLYTWPIKCILTVTIPNPKTWRKLYPLTFLMCVIFIGLNSYMIVWMITIMGKRFRRRRASLFLMKSWFNRSHIFCSWVGYGINFPSSGRLHARSDIKCADGAKR